MFCRYALDPDIKWLIPTTVKNSNPYPGYDAEGRFYKEILKLYYFVEGGYPNLKQNRREAIFQQVLESITPDDANLLIGAVNKKIYVSGLTETIVKEAFEK
jgi:hypothetical protein